MRNILLIALIYFLYSNAHCQESCSVSIPGSFEGTLGITSFETALDFDVEVATSFTLQQFDANFDALFDNATIKIYSDNTANPGFPGNLIQTFSAVAPTSTSDLGNGFFHITFELPSTVLNGGSQGKKFWISVFPNTFSQMEYTTTIHGRQISSLLGGSWYQFFGGDGVFTVSGTCEEQDIQYCETNVTVVEPITNVNFVGIDNTTASTSTVGHEMFTAMQGNLNQGGTYPISVQGNTNGNNTNYITVFVDWNGDNSFDDDGERYEVGTISNSTGADGTMVSGTISVPMDAQMGVRRMRVIKSTSAYATTACGAYQGQVEDYSLNVDLLKHVDCEISISNTVTPINLVNFAGIYNSTSLSGTVAHEKFYDIEANVIPGNAYQLKVRGTTNGQYEYLAAFIDWDGDGRFSNGEIFHDVNPKISNGTDGVEFTVNISVPSNAVLGLTKMRIIKATGDHPINPCGTYVQGQAEDYSVLVGNFNGDDDYCAPNFTGFMDIITSITFADIDYSSSNSPLPLEYHLETVADVMRGQIVPIEVQKENNSSFYITAYFDWNKNNVFDDNEKFDLYGNSETSYQNSIYVPANAQIGETRMRVILASSDFDQACGEYIHGQMIDFTVNVSEGSGQLSSDCFQGNPSNDFEMGAVMEFYAEDFTVSAGNNLIAETIELNVLSVFTVGPVTLTFREDLDGKPSSIIHQVTVTPTSQEIIGLSFGVSVRKLILDIDPIYFSGGNDGKKYWIQPFGLDSIGNRYFWEFTSVNSGDSPIHQYQNETDSFVPVEGYNGVFRINCTDGVVGDGDCGQGNESNDFEDGYNVADENNSVLLADDFSVSPGNTMTVEKVVLNLLSDFPAQDITLRFYNDNNGKPGTLISTLHDIVPVSQEIIGEAFDLNVYEVVLDIDPQEFTGGGAGENYWLSPQVSSSWSGMPIYWEVSSQPGIGSDLHYSVVGGPWEKQSGFNAVFNLLCEDEPPFEDEYCTLVYVGGVVPMTHLIFNDIDNTSTPSLTAPVQEYFLDQVVNVERGQTYDVSFQGNTIGDYTFYFTAFIDWNQNGVLNDAGEVYQLGTVSNSSGIDDVFGTYQLQIPDEAALGETRMRIIYNYDFYHNDPCLDIQVGQAEEYTINIGEMSVSDVMKADFAYYPNPVEDVLHIRSDKKISEIAIYDLTGKKIFGENLNFNTNQIKLSHLQTGVYVVRIRIDGKEETFKIIKK